ncbi:Siderophore iron transporter mirB [Tolypocladium capitatum]|uniref:Siderophore iron transporter mirB n=1 Tax=Tolypocladium capitatum TaxID=45235 RepID=A0A2K3QN03_9HYPO|nr:Siderophore iron transporter mirB [Tolypocladium capitatum]
MAATTLNTSHFSSDLQKDGVGEAHEADVDGNESDGGSRHKQDGVRRVEAITTVWTRAELVAMFVLLYLVAFVDALLENVQGNLVAYITSSFQEHGLLATTGIVATILGGVCTLTIAKIIDIWGRCEGFAVMVALVAVGIIMKATCKNVETYAAAHTIYWVGHLGLGYVITVMLADMTTLRNRLILFGLQQTPLIASTFAGPAIAQLFYENVNYNWAFGSFCIILVAFCIPVAVIFAVSKQKAVRAGLYPPRNGGRTLWQSAGHYFVEFDVVGMFLTVFGWSLLLLPFSLASRAPDGWSTGYIIAMIVLGAVLLIAFGVWEKFFAPVSYFPWKYLKDRTILGACLLYGFMFASIFAWDTYYYSYLQVVHFLDITTSGYVLNSFSLMAALISPFVGLLVRYTGDYKWQSIAGIPFAVLGTALLIRFRTPDTHVGVLVMCQLFNGVSSGIWAMTAQLAIMASVSHQQVAVAIAMFGLFGSIGAAVGSAIAGGIWNNVLPVKLEEFLPADSKNQTAAIFASIVTQMNYTRGSPERNAIIEAYGDVQRKMVIAGSAFLPLCLAFLLMWRNVNVKRLEEKGTQTRGTVF